MQYQITKDLPDRFQITTSVNAIIVRDNQYLLVRRANTGWADGYFTLPAGHIDGGESLTAATIREIKEEVGLSVEPENLELVYVMHRSDKEDDKERLDFYFLVIAWEGEPSVSEPDKSDKAAWFTLDEVPEKTLENVKRTLKNYSHKLLDEVNWN